LRAAVEAGELDLMDRNWRAVQAELFRRCLYDGGFKAGKVDVLLGPPRGLPPSPAHLPHHLRPCGPQAHAGRPDAAEDSEFRRLCRLDGGLGLIDCQVLQSQ
jgi:hypothetical protein